jgi:type II secretory pathway predicted ATPase ExeA
MELGAAGLKEQPFRSQGRPIVFFAYAGQEKTCDFLSETYAHNGGLALLQGPPLSGKSTIIHYFADRQKERPAVAVIDGAGLSTTSMLEGILREFGYEHKFDTINELLNMLKVFIHQQTASGSPPLLIIENIHEIGPSALGVLCELAEVRIREKFALRMVLVSDRAIDYIVRAPAMECMSKRLTGDFHVEPLTMDETSDYLYAKMRHGGCLDPDHVFPGDVCDELYRASGGWPGLVDRLAVLALENAEYCPVRPEHVEHPPIPKSTRAEEPTVVGVARNIKTSKSPVLCLTHNGETLREIRFSGSRLLIGRSEHNDICIEGDSVSRHHALLVRHGSSTLLMDLNSSNGTYVNSWRVSNQVLTHEDTIMIGEHGLKFIDENAPDRVELEGVNLDDTIVRETIAEMGRVLGQDRTTLIPEKNKLPELGGDSF